MDKKDMKILAELLANSRIPIKHLAKKVGISREVASYRINKLVKNKIITNFYTIINTKSLGYTRFACFMQLKNISREKEKQFIEYLTKHQFITSLGPVIGKWNLVFDILTKNREDLHTILKEITSNIQGCIETYFIIITESEQETFPTKLLGINKEIHYKNPNKKQKLDKTGLEVLRLLSTDSRIEYKEISKRLRLTPNTIKYRIKNLEKSVIQGYTISIDIRRLGYEWHDIQIKLMQSREEKPLLQFLRQNPKVTYFYRYLGNENWDIDIGIAVKNSVELRDFIVDLREKFGDILKIHDIYLILEESKGNYPPEGIFNP